MILCHPENPSNSAPMVVMPASIKGAFSMAQHQRKPMPPVMPSSVRKPPASALSAPSPSVTMQCAGSRSIKRMSPSNAITITQNSWRPFSPSLVISSFQLSLWMMLPPSGSTSSVIPLPPFTAPTCSIRISLILLLKMISVSRILSNRSRPSRLPAPPVHTVRWRMMKYPSSSASLTASSLPRSSCFMLASAVVKSSPSLLMI